MSRFWLIMLSTIGALIVNVLMCTYVRGAEREVEVLVPRLVNFRILKAEAIRDPYLDPIDKDLKYGGEFGTNFDILRYGDFSLFMDNRLFFNQSQVTGQVKHGGWEFRLGASVQVRETSFIELGKYHKSEHCFECVREKRFPVNDSYYINLVLFKEER